MFKTLAIVLGLAAGTLAFAQTKPAQERETPTKIIGDIPAETVKAIHDTLIDYATRFDARDTDAVKAMLVGDAEPVGLAMLMIEQEFELQKTDAAARAQLAKADDPNARPYTANMRREFANGTLEKTGDDYTLKNKRGGHVMMFRNTDSGWRIVITPADLYGLDGSVIEPAAKKAIDGWKQLQRRVEAKEFKSFQDYTTASAAVRKEYRNALKAKPTTQPK